jgi:hypothetical protein
MHPAFMLLLLLSVPAYAQGDTRWTDTSWAPPDLVSVRNCRRPAGAKEAQVVAFDNTTLQAKLAVTVGEGHFKVVTIRLWNRSEDPRPVVPIVEAARITQGKLQFYTPNLDADPDPVHDKQFVLMASLGGAQVCWATESALLKEGTNGRAVATEPPSAGTAGRDTGRRRP